MKDINGNIIKKGDNVLLLESGNKVPAQVIAIGKTKVKYKLLEGYLTIEHSEVPVQKILAKLTIDKKNKTLLENMLLETKPGMTTTKDMNPGVDLNTLRAFGVGFDSKNKLGINEGQEKYSKYGKIYRLLKEAFDCALEDAEMKPIAKSISNIAKYVGNKLNN